MRFSRPHPEGPVLRSAALILRRRYAAVSKDEGSGLRMRAGVSKGEVARLVILAMVGCLAFVGKTSWVRFRDPELIWINESVTRPPDDPTIRKCALRKRRTHQIKGRVRA